MVRGAMRLIAKGRIRWDMMIGGGFAPLFVPVILILGLLEKLREFIFY